MSPSVVVLGGGELFRLKEFVPIAKSIAKRHTLVIVSNLSYDVSEFCNEIDPNRITGLSVSVHYTERSDLSAFLKM
jgi:hypothetical protein